MAQESREIVSHSLLPGGGVVYLLLVILALFGTLAWWGKRFRRNPRLLQVFAGAVVGAFLGAKLGYLFAEGWLAWGTPAFWSGLVAGKTILGALLGGYGGVEATKWMVGYDEVTGDRFAAVVPVGIIIGRLGCLAHGCCRGVVVGAGEAAPGAGLNRWPAPLVEIGFNLLAITVFWVLRRRHLFPGQHFHLYLIGYGIFRFGHEFLRETPRVAGAFSGYQFLALGVGLLGIVGWIRRQGKLTKEKKVV